MSKSSDGKALLFLFPKGCRTGASEIRQLVRRLSSVSISHDPSESGTASEQSGDAGVLELLCEGLTFDLAGLGSDNSIAVPHVRDSDTLLDGGLDNFEAISLAPGPHLQSGAHTLPIMRVMMALGATLASELANLAAVVWPASGRTLGASQFTNAIDAWLKTGSISGSGLISFDQTMDNAIQSQGLAHFTGQELRLEPDLAHEQDAALRFGARLLDHLIHAGKLTNAEQLTGPDGAPLLLEPSVNGSFIRARRG